MIKKQYASIILACLAVAIAAGLWRMLPKSAVPETPNPAPRQAENQVPAGLPAGAAVPAAVVTAPDPIRSPSSPLPTGAVPATAAKVQPPQPPVAEPAPAPTTPVPAQPADGTIDPSVVRFTDTSIPVENRMAEVEQLGQRGDADAVRTLMKLGDTCTYLNYKAIEALGNVKTPEVARYLEGKTGDKDPRIISYAVESLAKVQGAEAVPAIAATIAANRQRPDGYQDTVCGACVKAFGDIGSPRAIPALEDEFKNTVGNNLQHEYGSQVVAALKAIGDPAGVPALDAYALRLQTQRDEMSDNPMGQRYLEGKIKEVRDAIACIKGEKQ